MSFTFMKYKRNLHIYLSLKNYSFFIRELQYILIVFKVLRERLTTHYPLFREILMNVIDICRKVFPKLEYHARTLL